MIKWLIALPFFIHFDDEMIVAPVKAQTRAVTIKQKLLHVEFNDLP